MNHSNHPQFNRERLRKWLAAVSLFGLLLMAEAGWSAPPAWDGRAGRATLRTPQLPPDEIPAIRLEQLTSAFGKYASIYYANGTRIAPGASAWSIPDLNEVRKTMMDYRIAAEGSSRFEAQTFERSTPRRINFVVILTSDAPLNRSGWRNSNGNCVVGVEDCRLPVGVRAMAVVPVMLLTQEPGDDAVRLNAREWLKIVRSVGEPK